MRGKVEIANDYQLGNEDHPRLCGEKWYNNRRGELYAGSPPPMRGKAVTRFLSCITTRITPAYAGKSACKTPVQVGSRDHPRLCGEKPEN